VLDEKPKMVATVISFNYNTYVDILNLPDSGLTDRVEAEISKRYQEAGWAGVEEKRVEVSGLYRNSGGMACPRFSGAQHLRAIHSNVSEPLRLTCNCSFRRLKKLRIGTFRLLYHAEAV